MFFENIGTMQTQLKSICREGKVTEVFPERHSCRVTFEDRDNLVSAELPILTLTAGENKIYWLPDIDERVVVLSASNDFTGGGGYVLGSLYTGDEKPLENNQNVYALKMSDNFEVKYEREQHNFQMTFNDGTKIFYENGESDHEMNIKFSDGCEISYSYGSGADFLMKFADGSTIEHDGQRGDLDMKIKGEINITAAGEINIESSQDVNVKGANIHLN